jgi:hypothetical protein
MSWVSAYLVLFRLPFPFLGLFLKFIFVFLLLHSAVFWLFSWSSCVFFFSFLSEYISILSYFFSLHSPLPNFLSRCSFFIFLFANFYILSLLHHYPSSVWISYTASTSIVLFRIHHLFSCLYVFLLIFLILHPSSPSSFLFVFLFLLLIFPLLTFYFSFSNCMGI